ncbi:MAG: hypothetical protein KDD83_20090 [Caldilineaceae bacterium]|nr:hypothetical protein [Caldilineaceae bacterium]
MSESISTGRTSLVEGIMDQTLRMVNDADAAAANKRVQQLRTQKPTFSETDMVEHLIKQKAIQAGTVGAVTAGASIIPGLGTLAAFTLGAATDVGVTLRLQSELVLEIAAARGHTLTADERRRAIMIVTGVNLGAERLVNQASRRLAQEAAERFAGRAAVKAVPFVGVAVSAGANVLTTYIVGRRADAYFRLGPEGMEDFSTSLRALSGMDERQLVDWLGEVMTMFGAAVAGGARRLGAATGRAARAAAGGLGAGASAAQRRVRTFAARRRSSAPTPDDQPTDEPADQRGEE